MISTGLNIIRSAIKINGTVNKHHILNPKIGINNVIYLQFHSVGSNINRSRVNCYMNLQQPEGRVTAEYIWIDSTGVNVRGKTKVLDFVPEVVCQLPVWTYDGSSTGQASGENSDVYIVPVAMYPDPFRGGENKIILCETYDHEKKPLATNHRKCCFETMEKAKDEKPWFGFEQEYMLIDDYPRPWPHSWPLKGYPGPQGPYYCGIGAEKVFGRNIVEAHLRACLYCGLKISGVNAEVTPSQWEFQIGPAEGIDAGDEVWVARYLLCRIAEEEGVGVTFDPKPVEGDWNGSGGHMNFSTEKMRQDNGYGEIEKAIKKLEKNHSQHIEVYDPSGGKDNMRRLTGHHETSSIHDFSWAVAHRGVSVRVTREIYDAQKGFFEDRRPAANADPYRVTNALVCTCCLS